MAHSTPNPTPEPTPAPKSDLTPEPPLFTERTALIVLLGSATGSSAGVLTYFAQGNIPAAILAGFAATGVAIGFFQKSVK